MQNAIFFSLLARGSRAPKTRFKRLTIESWKLFDRLSINFHDRLTILTGANASGKTTILNLLASHFGWEMNELATPIQDSDSGVIRFIKRLWPKGEIPFDATIGKLLYENGKEALLQLPDQDLTKYEIIISPKQPVNGFYSPAHRPTFHYYPVDQVISEKEVTMREAFEQVSQSIRNWIGRVQDKPSNYYIKRALINWCADSGGVGKKSKLEYFNGFEEILKQVLPKSFGFKKFLVRNSEVLLETDSSEFLLDSCSGGISAIIDLVWQIYMFQARTTQGFTVLIDEVENHLHANMQRAILPDLINAFPMVQFIVATHSPLIIGSVRDSNVYALRYNVNMKIESEELDIRNKAKNATDILNKILGVPFTMPLWVEDELDGIVKRYLDREIDQRLFDEIRDDLGKIGLEELMPLAIRKTLKRYD